MRIAVRPQRLVGLVIGVAALFAPLSAGAAETGFEVGLRTGFGAPLGRVDAYGGGDVASRADGIVPVWLDAGYRIYPSVMIGGYFQYAVGTGCESEGECSATSTRLGIQGQYHFLPHGAADPWMGVGFGYEWLRSSFRGYSAYGLAYGEERSARGFELANLQIGLDGAVAPILRLGLFVSFSIGQFDERDDSCSGDIEDCESWSGEIREKAIHHWIVGGVRGVFTGP